MIGTMVSFDKFPWYHKLWFIPFLVIGTLILASYSYAKYAVRMIVCLVGRGYKG